MTRLLTTDRATQKLRELETRTARRPVIAFMALTLCDRCRTVFETLVLSDGSGTILERAHELCTWCRRKS